MLAQDSREKLNESILYFITEADIVNKMQDIAKQLKDKIRPSRVSKIFNRGISIELLQDYEVYYLSKILFQITKNNQINPVNYFTDIEINNYEDMDNLDYSQEVKNKIVLNNVIEVIPNRMWNVGKITAQELKSFMDNNLITYNTETQRETEKRVVNGRVIEKIKLYKDSIRDIKNAMLKEEYFPTALAFNILANGYEKYNYDRNNLTLTIEIDENNECSIVDGFHRISAIVEALRENPNLNQMMKLDIFHYDKSIKRFIRQEGKKNPLAEELESYYDTENIYTLIVEDINNEGSSTTNFIKGNIGQDFESVELMGKYCTFSTLIKSLKDNFKIDEKDIIKRRKVKEFLIEFMNEIIGIHVLEFKNVKQSRKENYSTYNNMFFGYIALASKLYGVDKWQDKLYDIITNIDFSKKSDIWKGKGIELKDIPGKHLSNLYSFFKGLYNENVEDETTRER